MVNEVLDDVKTVVFFNHFHNGDVLHAYPFIVDYLSCFLQHHKNVEKIMFAHSKATKNLICDGSNSLPNEVILQIPLELCPVDKSQTIVKSGSTLFINTWVGAYFGKFTGIEDSVSLKFNEVIYEGVATAIGLKGYPSISAGHFPFIRTSIGGPFHESKAFKKIFKNIVLMCNGPGESNQCSYNGDMAWMIQALAQKYPKTLFVCTHKSSSFNQHSNIVFTDDLFNRNDGRSKTDLCMIGGFARICDLIVGRYSGPFCFAATHDNVCDHDKTFLVFGDRETDCYYYQTTVQCKMNFHKFQDEAKLFNELEAHVAAL